MTQSLITSQVSESKIGHIKDLLTPVLRRLLKDDRQAQAIIEAGNTLQDRFTQVVNDLLAKLTNTFMVTVDYARSLPDMIAAGKYDSVKSDITAEHFPITGTGKQDLEVLLVHFGKDMESEDVLKELDKLGLRAATLPELLAFGETYPNTQLQFPIIALGSIWQNPVGFRRVPCLAYWHGERLLRLRWFGYRWSDLCRFAAVRK